MTLICRLCLKSEQGKNCEYISVNKTDNNGVSIATLVKTLVPELFLGLSVNPVICSPCYDALRDAYSFRLQCLRSENLIGIFMRENHTSSVTIVLQDVVNYWMNVYKSNACQTEVARSNLAEWFGVTEKDDNLERENKSNKKRTSPINIDPRPTLNKVILNELRQEPTKDDTVQVETSKIDNPDSITKSEKNKGNSAINKVGFSTSQDSENNDLDKVTNVNQLRENLKILPKDPCNCPLIADDCPTSKNFTRKTPAKIRMDKRRQHGSCVVVCDYRHIQDCKYYKPNNTEILCLPVSPPKISRKIQQEKPVEDKNALQENTHITTPVVGIGANKNEPENVTKDLQENQRCQKSTKKLTENRYNAWLQAIGIDSSIEKVSRHNRVCSVHFAAQDMTVTPGGKILLKSGAIPKFNLGPNVEIRKSLIEERSLQTVRLADKSSKSTIPLSKLEILRNAQRSSADKNESDKMGDEEIVGKLIEIRNAETSNTPSATPNLAQDKDKDPLADDMTPEPVSEKPMPMIRVRPVSSMTQIRTLNHELFPQTSETSTIQKAPNTSISQTPKLLKSSSKPPVVLNSKLKSPCNCPSIVEYCPTNLNRSHNIIKQEHRSCVVLCDYRHMKECKYYKPLPQFKTYRKKQHEITTEAEKTENIALRETSLIHEPIFVVCDIEANQKESEDDAKEFQHDEHLQELTKKPADNSSKLTDLLESKQQRKEIDNLTNQNTKVDIPRDPHRAPSDTNENKRAPSDNFTNCTLTGDTFEKSSEVGLKTLKEVNEKSIDKLTENRHVETSNKDTTSATSNLLHAKDEESLGIITFQPGNTTPEQVPDKPMPMIRVRPVSSLKQICSLNHELFPQSSDTSKVPDVSNVSTPQQPKLNQLSGKLPVLLNSKLDLVPVTYDYIKKVGIKRKNLKKIIPVQPLRVLMPTDCLPSLVKLDIGKKNNKTCLKVSQNSVVQQDDPLGNETAGCPDVIDIKEEPFESTESDCIGELAELEKAFIKPDSWDGETTRSASETSLVDPVVSDNLSRFINNIPDLVEEFDEPEYVHINNVSFDDLHKLMKEAKESKKQLEKTGTNLDTKNNDTATNLQSQDKNVPIKVSSTIPIKKLPTASPIGFDDSSKTQTRQDIEDPLYVPSRRNVRQRKLGKRLRLVPVDVDESKVPKKKKRGTPSTMAKTTGTNQTDVCVLYTNFTSDGDYINDHDYLVNPYLRNNMYMFKEDVERCICLLCGWFHPVANHIEHMKCHSTRCSICNVDFHNVFILNLHVRVHTYHCAECDVNVTYARYRHHAETHNLSLTLSNIELPPEVKVPKKKVKRKSYHTLDALLSKPKIKFDITETDKSSANLRRSQRITKSKENENVGQEEETCMNDEIVKTITPSEARRRRLLPRNAKNKKIEVKDENTAIEDKEVFDKANLGFINLADLVSGTQKLDSKINISLTNDNFLSSNEGVLKNSSPEKPVIKTNKKKRRAFSAINLKRKTIKRKRLENEEKSQETKKVEKIGLLEEVSMEKIVPLEEVRMEKKLPEKKMCSTANRTEDLASKKAATEVKVKSNAENSQLADSPNTKRAMRSMQLKKVENSLELQKPKIAETITNQEILQKSRAFLKSTEKTPKVAEVNQVRVKVNVVPKSPVSEFKKSAEVPISSCVKIKSRNVKMPAKSEVQRIPNAASSQITARKILIKGSKVLSKNELKYKIKSIRLRPSMVARSVLKSNLKTKFYGKKKTIDQDQLGLKTDESERSNKNQKSPDTSISPEKQIAKQNIGKSEPQQSESPSQ